MHESINKPYKYNVYIAMYMYVNKWIRLFIHSYGDNYRYKRRGALQLKDNEHFIAV